MNRIICADCKFRRLKIGIKLEIKLQRKKKKQNVIQNVTWNSTGLNYSPVYRHKRKKVVGYMKQPAMSGPGQ